MAERPEPSYTGDQPFFFVSYGHADSELVYPEMRWLQEAGFNLWYDEGIHVGSVWRRAIADALTAAAGMVFVATKSSVESDHCLKELSFVLDEGKPVFVVQLDDTRLPGLLRLSLADRQMLKRADFDERTYRAKLTQALSTVAKPTPRAEAAEATAGERIGTGVPAIGLQVLATGDAETTFWGESLIEDLAGLLGQRAFGITNTHDATKDLAALGRALDANYVLSGAVRRADDRYRVNLKLTKGSSGAQVWAGRYDEQGGAIDAADAVCRLAAVDISAAIVLDERARLRGAGDEELSAWELCIVSTRGPFATVRQRDRVIELLRRAVERDPNFALANALLSVMLGVSVYTLFSRTPDADIAEALRHADRALALAPGNPHVMSGAALTHRMFGNEALALDLAQRATAIGGIDGMFGAYFGNNTLPSCLMQAGRLEEAIELMLASRPAPERELYTAYAALGRWEDALIWIQRHAASFPTSFLGQVDLANALAVLGRLEEARQIMRRVVTTVPTFTLARYEQGNRVGWRDRDQLVAPLLAGLRKLEIA
jgi:tetratricopeptide (TPR) repeat protein